MFDEDFNNVALAVTGGGVEINEHIPGDVNSDGSVNNKDAVLLLRYVAGYSVTVNEDAIDTNGDGSVNNKDAVLLLRYVAGYSVTIH